MAEFDAIIDSVTDEELDAAILNYDAEIRQAEARRGIALAIKEARSARNALIHPQRLSRPAEGRREPHEEGPTPPRAEAILTVMGERPDAVWSGDAVLRALEDRGWQPGGRTPKNSVDAGLSRLAQRGRVRRVGRGAYKLVASNRLVDRLEAIMSTEGQDADVHSSTASP